MLCESYNYYIINFFIIETKLIVQFNQIVKMQKIYLLVILSFFNFFTYII